MYAAPTRKTVRNLQNIPQIPKSFHTLHIDHLGPVPSVNILVNVDTITKYVKLYPVNTTSTREVSAAFGKYFSYYSRPVQIISDRRTFFTSTKFENYLEKLNIGHINIAPASPLANGQVERI